MANIKTITHLYGSTGLTLYCIVRRDIDGFLLNDADGAFANGPTDFYIAMAENATIKGLYEKSESRAAWNDGDYTILVCRQNGGSPDIASDTIVGGGELQIISDLEASIPMILADTNELQIDNVDGGRTDLLIDSIITKVDHLAVDTLGLGACTWVYTLTDSVTALPIEGAEVWVTTDVAGLNVVAHGYTNASGIVTFYLDAGTNYFWRQHGNYTFTNPDTEIVS